MSIVNFFLYFEASDFRVFIQIRAPILDSGIMIYNYNFGIKVPETREVVQQR